MSSRFPRRAFAASFVVTIAALPACRVGNNADHRTTPPTEADTTPRDHRGDGEPEPDADPSDPGRGNVDHREDADDTAQTGRDNVDHRDDMAPEKPATANAWVIMKKADGTCGASVETSCAVGRPGSCNPPMPSSYACPTNVTVTVDHPLHVVRASADAECYVKVDMSACHPGATCNPPPPRKVACPQ